VQFSADTYQANEAVAQTVVTLTRSGPTDGTTVVRYIVNDGSATQRSDYTYAAGTVRFAPGETQKELRLLINEDAIDDPSILVGEHYHDFLNRQSDPDGQAFWTNEVAACGSDQRCIEVKRVNVSAAFFLSIEFQQSGYLIERIYKTAYGDKTAASTLNGSHTLSVPIVRIDEFLADTQEIGQDVIVLQSGWQAKLEANKRAFTAEFVERDRFAAAFPASMSAADFVDRLNGNAGNPLSQSERDQLVSDLSTGTKTRGEILRSVAEDRDFAQAEFNRAFVLMQYIGYLRRSPDSAPDSDYTGYDFWLTKLNNFNGDYIGAEMVKAFLSSGEYRERFQGGASRGNPTSTAAMRGTVPRIKEAMAKTAWFTLPASVVRSFIG
jgi:hypothetical protein